MLTKLSAFLPKGYDSICTKDTSGACGYAVICSSKEVALVNFLHNINIRVLILDIDNSCPEYILKPEYQRKAVKSYIIPLIPNINDFPKTCLMQKQKETSGVQFQTTKKKYEGNSPQEKYKGNDTEHEWIEDLYDSTCGPLVTSDFEKFTNNGYYMHYMQRDEIYGRHNKSSVSMGGVLQRFNTKVQQQISICDTFKGGKCSPSIDIPQSNNKLTLYIEGGQLLPFIRQNKLYMLLGCDSLLPILNDLSVLGVLPNYKLVWNIKDNEIDPDAIGLCNAILKSYYSKHLESCPGVEWGEVYLIPNFVYHIDCMVHIVNGTTCLVSTGNENTDEYTKKILANAGFTTIETGFPLGFANTETVRDIGNKLRVIFNDNIKGIPIDLEQKLNKVGYTIVDTHPSLQTITFAPNTWDKVSLGGIGCRCKTISKEQYDELVNQSKSMFSNLNKQ